MSHLFSPTSIGNVALANRIVIAPMCEYSAEAGCATDWHMIHLGHLALSGAALLFTEATAVEADACIAGPALKLTEKIADRLGVDRSGLPDPIPPALLRFFGQHIRLDSRKAERLLDLEWTSYRAGLADAARALRHAA